MCFTNILYVEANCRDVKSLKVQRRNSWTPDPIWESQKRGTSGSQLGFLIACFRLKTKQKKNRSVLGLEENLDLVLFLFSWGSWSWSRGWGAGGASFPKMLGKCFPQAEDRICQCLSAGDAWACVVVFLGRCSNDDSGWQEQW